MAATEGRVELQQRRQQPATVRFTLPALPVSMNRMYSQRFDKSTGRLAFGPSDEHVLWRTKMGEYVPARARFKIADDSNVHVDVIFHYPFRFKNGNVRRLDASNFLKGVYDLVSRKLGFDDYRIRGGSFSSVDGDEQKVVVTLREVPSGTE